MSSLVNEGHQASPEADPLHTSIAEHVRGDSRAQLRPTRLELLDDQGNPMETTAVKAVLDRMKSLPDYADIEYVETADGGVHAHSTQFVNRQLASACALASLGDHAATLAATVRDESRIYPRPTAVSRFRDPPWSLTPLEIEEGLRVLEASQGYADIRRTTASNGAVYLFSDRFLSAGVAAGMAEWEAVERDLNP
jgi:hypothetical protein